MCKIPDLNEVAVRLVCKHCGKVTHEQDVSGPVGICYERGGYELHEYEVEGQ